MARLRLCITGPERDDYRIDDEPTIVIADDNAAILEAVDNLLSGSFRIVAQVGDGLEAFRAINEHIPQLAVLDSQCRR
jgi:CheY-like chemotaxis protein